MQSMFGDMALSFSSRAVSMEALQFVQALGLIVAYSIIG